MAICRIYLCTYQRNHLLKRALESLLDQTMKDWVCELHNDDPQDLFPQQLVEKIADPRISVVNHAKNLGATRTFNLIFQPASEPFVSLLEDDNWWEAEFLEKMLEALERYPSASVAWANMRLWKEENDQTWTDTGKNIWDEMTIISDSYKLFGWPNLHNIRGALHSQGAMLVRSEYNYVVPEETLSTDIEAVRERMFQYPILFVSERLANFAVTKNTSPSKNRCHYVQSQVLLAGSFFKNVRFSEETLYEIWKEARSKTAKSTGTLFFSALIFPECRYLLKYAILEDWTFFIATSLKRPLVFWQALKSVVSNQNLWNFLDQQTALKVQEAQHSGFKEI
ncbi:MAG: glycosyltransferase family 2 protein [Microcoleaceae cyanobacterium]